VSSNVGQKGSYIVAIDTTVQFLIVEPYHTCKYVIVLRRISVVNY